MKQMYTVSKDQDGDQSDESQSCLSKLWQQYRLNRRALLVTLQKTDDQLNIVKFLTRQKLLWLMFKKYIPKSERGRMLRSKAFKVNPQ